MSENLTLNFSPESTVDVKRLARRYNISDEKVVSNALAVYTFLSNKEHYGDVTDVELHTPRRYNLYWKIKLKDLLIL